MNHIANKQYWFSYTHPLFWHSLDALIEWDGVKVFVLNAHTLKWDSLEFSTNNNTFDLIMNEIDRNHEQFTYCLYQIDAYDEEPDPGYSRNTHYWINVYQFEDNDEKIINMLDKM